MAGQTLGKIIGMFKKEAPYTPPLAYKRSQWGNLGPNTLRVLEARSTELFRGYECFDEDVRTTIEEVKHLFKHTGGSNVGDTTDELLQMFEKEIANAHEQARLAWIAMDAALKGLKAMSRLIVDADVSGKEVRHG